MTSEWSQRTGLITFALVPVRSRVLGAKLVASLVLAVAMLAMTVAVVAAGVLVASPGIEGTWSDVAPLIGQSAVFLTAGMVTAVAFGAVLLASAPALVALFALPSAWMAVVSLAVFSGIAPVGRHRARPRSDARGRHGLHPVGRSEVPRGGSRSKRPYISRFERDPGLVTCARHRDLGGRCPQPAAGALVPVPMGQLTPVPPAPQ